VKTKIVKPKQINLSAISTLEKKDFLIKHGTPEHHQLLDRLKRQSSQQQWEAAFSQFRSTIEDIGFLLKAPISSTEDELKKGS